MGGFGGVARRPSDHQGIRRICRHLSPAGAAHAGRCARFFCARHRVGCAGPPPREKLVSKTLGRPGCLRLARSGKSPRLVAKELRSFFSYIKKRHHPRGHAHTHKRAVEGMHTRIDQMHIASTYLYEPREVRFIVSNARLFCEGVVPIDGDVSWGPEQSCHPCQPTQNRSILIDSSGSGGLIERSSRVTEVLTQSH